MAGDRPRCFLAIVCLVTVELGALLLVLKRDLVWPSSPAVVKRDNWTVRTAEASGLLPAVYTDDRLVMAALPPIDRIPRILHFMWKGRELPRPAADNVREWARLHPGWRLVLWTDADLKRTMHASLAGSPFLALYNRLPKPIMRVDFSRYVILFLVGGVYADVDVQPLLPLGPVLRHHSCIIAREPEVFGITINPDSAMLASNFLMASRPGHPFWPHMMETALRRKGIIIEWTGPVAVMAALASYKARHPLAARDGAVFLAPSLYFDQPISLKGDRIHLHLLNMVCAGLKKRKRPPRPYAAHVCAVLRREQRLSWEEMYRYPRHFAASFARHHRYNTYGFNYVAGAKLVSADSLPLGSPQGLVKQRRAGDPFQLNEQILNNSLITAKPSRRQPLFKKA